jgi:hypothetical protein
MQVKILGKHWNIRHGRRDMKDHGSCDPPDKKDKEIKVRRGLSPKDELESIVHEVTHSGAWQLLDEGWVREFTEDLTNVLWTAGYRPMDGGACLNGKVKRKTCNRCERDVDPDEGCVYCELENLRMEVKNLRRELTEHRHLF